MDKGIVAQDLCVPRSPIHMLRLHLNKRMNADVKRSIVRESHGNTPKIGCVGQSDLGDRFANKLRVLVDRVGHG